MLKEGLLAQDALRLPAGVEPLVEAGRVELVLARGAAQRGQRQRLGVQDRVADGARLHSCDASR